MIELTQSSKQLFLGKQQRINKNVISYINRRLSIEHCKFCDHKDLTNIKCEIYNQIRSMPKSKNIENDGILRTTRQQIDTQQQRERTRDNAF